MSDQRSASSSPLRTPVVTVISTGRYNGVPSDARSNVAISGLLKIAISFRSGRGGFTCSAGFLNSTPALTAWANACDNVR